MPDAAFTTHLAEWAHTLLVWIGFGTLAGLLAKSIMPGRNPGGPIATLLVGIGGTCIGMGVLTYLNAGARISPITPLGFVAASAGAAVLLFFHKMLGGYIFAEQGEGVGPDRSYIRRPYYRRRSSTRVYDE